MWLCEMKKFMGENIDDNERVQLQIIIIIIIIINDLAISWSARVVKS